ncbi:MAG: epoxyqueuosine reductase QueH [Eggerthellaceae bacterium]|nr:epoxyqueuosine reductase QueH [Eggerthellaceae bacterium]
MGEAAREKFGVITHEANNDPLPEDSENRAGRNDCDAEGRESDGHDGHDSEGSDNDGHDDSSLSAASEAELARQARCRACYRLRFEETAQYAAEHGIEAIGTTLSVSPYQYTAIIREELQRAAMRAGVKAHFEDYRPFYDNATRRSRDAGMYRQNYCACRFSDEEAQFEREERKRARKEAKAAEAAARAEQQSAELAAANAKRAEKAAYADKQARKRALLKQLREQQGSNG